MKTRHWDWLHTVTLAVALISLCDSERRIVLPAVIATWPVTNAVVTQSTIDTLRVTIVARHGPIYAHRRIASYAFLVDGRHYTGRTLSWYPFRDAVALKIGAPLIVHYRRSAPWQSAVFIAPTFTTRLESAAGIVLIVFTAFTWHQRRRSAESDDDEYDRDRIITLHVPLA